MTCNTCGATLPEGAKFCGVCGATMPAPVEPIAPSYQEPPQPVYQEAPVYQQAPPAYQPAAAADERPAKGSPYAPISGIGYIGYFILFAIPVIGWILCFAWAFSKKGNVNRHGLARAMCVFLIIGLIMGIAGFALGMVAKKQIENGTLTENGMFSWAQGLIPGGAQGAENGGGTENGPFSWIQGLNPENSGTQEPNGGGSANTPPGSFNTGDGTVFTSQWPNNEFTKQVPKPKFEVSFGGVSENEFGVLCTASIDQLKDYVKELQKAGFTKNVSTTDENAFGMVIYGYSADNGKGYKVEVGPAMGGASTIKIRKT